MFAWNYQDDFFAGYDHGKQAGILSIADHHFVPGKKFWTWGAGPRGVMWEKILTDDDGPYIELMAGAYSDNQPDYSWLQPYETKSFQMYWYPFRDIDGVKNANLDAAVNLEIDTNKNVAKVGFCVTSAHEKATVTVSDPFLRTDLLRETISISPGKPYVKQITIPPRVNIYEVRASLSVDGSELVSYSPARLTPMEMPAPVVPPPAPSEIKTVEELYLAGQRIEQFNAPGTASPEPYWEEALRRDPGDARVNTALGIRQLKEARFAEAEQHFRKAIERLSANYTSPKDGEAYYYLGVALKAQDQTKAAEDAFAKAAWSEAWRSPAYFSLAEIATGRSNYTAALDDLNRSLDANALNIRALTLKAAALRHLGRTNEALAVLDIAAQKTDPLDVRLMAERWLAGNNPDYDLVLTLQDHAAAVLETVAEFVDAGLRTDAREILKLIRRSPNEGRSVLPLANYWLEEMPPPTAMALSVILNPSIWMDARPNYLFPFQWELIPVLREAIKSDPQDAHAPYYLGNLLFDWQPEEALKLWEQSAKLDPSFAIVHRNIATALLHQKPEGDTNRAIAELEQAVACPVKYAMHFTELDELYAATGAAPEKRLALLEQNHDTVAKRDDALSREIGLKVFAGKYEEAIQLMTGRTFSVWEGGTLDVASHWVTAHLGRGRQELAARQFQAALADFQAAKNIPDNLPNDGRGSGGHEAELNYWIGNAYDDLGDKDKAAQSWKDAQAATSGGGGGRRGGRGGSLDRQAGSYYQALARRALGQTDEADRTLHTLLDNANRDLQGASARAGSAHYSAGLAHLGLGEKEQARAEFELALRAVPDSLGPKMELNQMR